MNKRLVAEAAARLQNPSPRTPEQERMMFASMAAESLKLEGIQTSTEDVLAAADEGTAERAHTEVKPAQRKVHRAHAKV